MKGSDCDVLITTIFGLGFLVLYILVLPRVLLTRRRAATATKDRTGQDHALAGDCGIVGPGAGLKSL